VLTGPSKEQLKALSDMNRHRSFGDLNTGRDLDKKLQDAVYGINPENDAQTRHNLDTLKKEIRQRMRKSRAAGYRAHGDTRSKVRR
jgi:hypothetical protein